MTSDRYIEKLFLYLLAASLLLHIGVFALLYYFPQSKPEPPKEPVFVDLQQVPEIKPPPKPVEQPVRRQSDRIRRVERQTAPRGNSLRDAPKPVQPPQAATPARRDPGPPTKAPAQRRETPIEPGSSITSLLKRPKQTSVQQSPGQMERSTARLYPSANRMAALEESYRRKFEDDIAEGDTRFLNTNDIQFGSFLHRFENAVYGVWRYPSEAARNGIEGITPVRITFNRRGDIVNVQLLETSGAKVLDDEVFRALRLIGPVGALPSNYNKDEFHLIAFFQYGVTRRFVR